MGIPGERVGPYHLVRLIGQGGMASVYAAMGPVGEVALKILHSEFAPIPEQVALFRAEGNLARKLDHPHLVRGLDAGFADSWHYAAFELVEGPNLAEHLKSGTLLADDAARLVHDILLGVAKIHAHGLAHCDANPHNILLAKDGTAKLGDFGVATPIGQRQTAVRGTYGYLSPEQARGKIVDQRTDIFSMGVTLWELWSGRRLFERSATHLTLTAGVEDPAPDLPNAKWNQLVQRALAKAPEDRFDTADDFAAALTRFF